MKPSSILIRRGDINQDDMEAMRSAGEVAWDIETSGLDWRLERIGSVQVAVQDRIVIVIPGEVPPRNLALVLGTRSVRKVFHHAMFDLRFMMSHWGVSPVNIACTKVASKILTPATPAESHSLQTLLDNHLGVHVSKEHQTSNWLAPRLTQAQLQYAANDVRYLLALAHHLENAAARNGSLASIRASWEYLPTRARLDVVGAGDVFTY